MFVDLTTNLVGEIMKQLASNEILNVSGGIWAGEDGLGCIRNEDLVDTTFVDPYDITFDNIFDSIIIAIKYNLQNVGTVNIS